MRALILPVAFALAARAASAQTLWTVSPDGTADFLDVATAVAAVAPGDVLLISPGEYGDVVVQKPLTLLGDPDGPRPTFDLLRIQSVERFDALHLQARALEVRNVPKLASVDDCVARTLELSGKLDLRVSRTTIRPEPAAIGATAVFLLGIPAQPDAARVRFLDCVIRGGRGLGFQEPQSPAAGFGGTGIFAGFASLQIAGTSVSGGDGTTVGRVAGSGGTGMVLAACGVDLRGSATDEIESGLDDPDLSVFVTGVAIDASSTCNVTWSGVTMVGETLGPVTQVADQPYLEISGDDGPSGVRTLELYAPADGALGFVALAGASAFDATLMPSFGAPLEIALGTVVGVVPMIPAGQDLPASKRFALPASAALAGVKVHAQALLVAGLSARLTNAATVLLAF